MRPCSSSSPACSIQNPRFHAIPARLLGRVLLCPDSAEKEPHTVYDYGLLNPVWAGTRAAELTSDTAFGQAMLDVEAAWCRAQIRDRKSTRLNSSHVANSYAVFC